MVSSANIAQAVSILNQGGLVAMPTETVYGLAADASNEAAIRKIFSAKERPYDHPLIVHLASAKQISDWACDIRPSVWKLIEHCWPGPLTLILKKQPHVLDIVTGHQETIGLRVPRHPIAQALLQAFGGGLAAPSANKFTHLSPTTAAAVQEELGQKVDLILDGGHCAVGLESTILDMSDAQPKILRPGMLSAAYLSQLLGEPVLAQPNKAIRVPGQHHLHYAPETLTQLMSMQQIQTYLPSVTKAIALITYSSTSLPITTQVHRIHISPEPAAYAHDLYHTLRLLDQQHYGAIIVEAVPETEEWDAIRDRLLKATAR